MTLRMVVLWGLALLAGMAGIAQAQTGASGDLADCLRDNPDRYADPGPAVDDQYAGPVDACRALIEGDGVQVTVTPAGDSGGPGDGSSPASTGGTSPRDGSAGSPATATPATGAGASGGTGTATGNRNGDAAEAPSAEGASSSRRTVERAIAQADAAGGLGGPGSAAGAPAWILALGGALLAAIAGVAALRVYRRGR